MDLPRSLATAGITLGVLVAIAVADRREALAAGDEPVQLWVVSVGGAGGIGVALLTANTFFA